jgi:hypothetical protein
MKIDPESAIWLLSRIKDLEAREAQSNKNWWLATHRNIWQGSYDVWFTEKDQIDAVEIPKARMQAALDAGIIKKENRMIGKYEQVVYSLTDLGEATLNESVIP